MNVADYFARLKYSGRSELSFETLRSLHRAHMLSVPFENLDIALGRTIICNEEAFLNKVVDQRRGGFCYELNGAFAALLRELGFSVTLLSARVAQSDGTAGPEFDHLALRVDLEEPWLVDVGFGDSFLEPLRLRTGTDKPEGSRRFRLMEENASLHMEMLEPGQNWKRQYSFTLTPRQIGDFAGMCHYHQTSPKSSFTQKSICSMATTDGRVTVADRKLIITRDGQRTESMLSSEEEWHEALHTHFGVRL